jgi:hypothetical protein
MMPELGLHRPSIVWSTRAALCLWVTMMFFTWPGVKGYPRAELHDLIYGQAHRPFVSRPLGPWLIRGCLEIVPDSVKIAIDESGGRFINYAFGPPLNVNPETVAQSPSYRTPNRLRQIWANGLSESIVAYVISFSWLLGFSWVCEKLWREFYELCVPQAAAWFSLLAVMGVPVFFRYYSYLYDFPSLCLFTLCLYLMAHRSSFISYFLAFCLSCISKETSLLLVGIFAIYHIASLRNQFWRYAICLAVQLAAFAAIRGRISLLYSHNPGSSLEYHLIDHNVSLLLKPYGLETAMTWFLMVFVVVDHWREKPWLPRVAVCMVVPLAGMCFFFGFLDELRDYYEVYAAALLLAGFTMARVFGYPIAVRAPVAAHDVPHLPEAMTQ